MRGANLISGTLRLVLLCGLLVACVQPQPKDPGEARQADSQSATSRADPAQISAAQSNAQDPEGASPARNAERAAENAALPKAPPIDDDPNRLIGLEPDELAETLGTPELIRQEAPAEIWQYRIGACVFDIFLYDRRVAYLEARDRQAHVLDTRSCLNQLLRARMQAPLG